MRIAYINSFYYPDEVGGAERSVKFLAETMAARGHDVLVVCLGQKESIEHINGIEVRRLAPSNLYHPLDGEKHGPIKKLIWHAIDAYNPLSAKKIKDLLTHWKPDVVHTNNLGGLSVGTWKAVKSLGQNVRLVHTLRDYYLICPNTSMFKSGNQCANRCFECKVLSLPKAGPTELVDAVVGNSHFILNQHINAGLFARAKQLVIYNAYKPALVREPDEPVIKKIGYIGRIAKTKGIEVLIDAVGKLYRRHPGLELVIAGSGDPDYVSQLKSRTESLPVTFLGQVKPADFYTSVDLVVVPSLWAEPLARVLFETMAHGLPLVSSATGGSPELVKPGQTGYLYEPADSADALAASIRRYLDGGVIANQAIRNNQLDAAKTFLPDHVASAYEVAYLE